MKNKLRMSAKRQSYIDLGAGILLLYVILSHAIATAGYFEITYYDLWCVTDADLIPKGVHALIGNNGKIHAAGINYYMPDLLFFVMQWFFYKSGQFFSKRVIVDEWKKDWHKLMKQFLLWSAIGYVLFVGFNFCDGTLTLRNATYSVIRDFILKGRIELNTPLWFLFSLFVAKQVANVILPQRDEKYFWIKSGCVIFACFGIAFLAYCCQFSLFPVWVANSALGVCFFTFGYCLSDYELKWWLLLPCVLLYAACCIRGFPVVSLVDNNAVNHIVYLLMLPCGFAGIVTYNVICRIISRYLHYISLPVEYVGKYAMIIYVSHGVIYKSVRRVLMIWGGDLYPYALWIILGAYFCFLPLLCYIVEKRGS